MTKAILGAPMFRGNSDAIISGQMTDALVAAIQDGTVQAGMAVSVMQQSNKTYLDVFAVGADHGFGGFLCAADINFCSNTAACISHGLSVVVLNAIGLANGDPVGIADGGAICAAADGVIVLNGNVVGQVSDGYNHLSLSAGASARINFTGYQVAAASAVKAVNKSETPAKPAGRRS